MDIKPAHTPKSISFFLLLLILMCSALQPAQAQPAQAEDLLPEFRAIYSVEKRDSIVGRATYELKKTEQGLHFSLKTKLVGFFALFMNDRVEEDSWLSGPHAQLQLQRYQYLHKGSERNRDVKLNVSWSTDSASDTTQATAIETTIGTVTGTAIDKPVKLTVQSQVWDALSFQLALMLDASSGADVFKYPVLSKGVLKQYEFKKLLEKELEIDEETVNAIKFERIHGDNITWIWLAPDKYHLPVLIERVKNNKVDTRMSLDWARTGPQHQDKNIDTDLDDY